GFREGRANFGYTLFPKGFLSFVQPLFSATRAEDRHGNLVSQNIFPGLFVIGRRNLQSEIDLNLNRTLTGDRVLDTTNFTYFAQIDPHRHFPRIGVNGFFGEDIDFFNVRVGTGGNVTGFATLRPTDHLTLELNSAVQWLNVDQGSRRGVRLF